MTNKFMKIGSFRAAAWGGGLALGLMSLVPARAVVIPAGATMEEDAQRAERAHEEGASHQCLAKVSLVRRQVSLSRKGAFETRTIRETGTGVYIGDRPDGRRLVLTGGHLIDPQADPSEVVQAEVRFGAEARAIPVRRIRLHPDFSFVDMAVDSRGGKNALEPEWVPIHNLAVLELDAAAETKTGPGHGAVPAVLDDPSSYTGPLMEATFAGFGPLGTSTSRSLVESERAHGGHTRVTLMDWAGHSAFMNWTPIGPGVLEALLAQEPDRNCLQFIRQESRVERVHPCTEATFAIQSHERQGLFTEEDGGGPLFFAGRLAGIASCSRYQKLEQAEGSAGLPMIYIQQIWEPLASGNHFEWLRGVQEGLPSAGRVIELKGKEAEVDLPLSREAHRHLEAASAAGTGAGHSAVVPAAEGPKAQVRFHPRRAQLALEAAPAAGENPAEGERKDAPILASGF